MAKIKFRRDTAAAWTQANPTLAQGEPGFEHDTGLLKIGDGSTAWTSLDYASGGGSLTSQSSVEVQTGDDDRWFVRLRREDNMTNPEYSGVIVRSTNYDSLGNAIVAAQIALNDGGVVIFKFTPAGALVWKKSVGPVDNTYFLDSNLVIDSDDNILFVVNPDDSNTKHIVKMNGETGAVIFSEILDYTESYDITAIAVDSDGNIIIGGHFYFPGNDNNDVAFVAKLNSSADTITWQHSLVNENRYSHINSLEIDFNDNIVVAGYTERDHDVNGETVTDEVMLVAKITSAGSLSWQKTIALEDVNEGRVTGISLDSLGNIYATGSHWVDTGTPQPWGGQRSNAIVIFKMTPLGVMVWDRRVGPGPCSWVGVSTAVGDDGDLYLYAGTYQLNTAGQTNNSAGYWNARLVLARYNKTTGAVIWQSYFDNPLAQEVPGHGTQSPWGGTDTDLMTVKGDKILIGGSVRFGVSDADLGSPGGFDGEYFNQGFLAQFDTAATRWSAEGWTLSTSHIPGKLTNTLVATSSTLTWQTDVSLTEEGSANIEALAVGVSARRTASKVNVWTFGKDGTFSAPADTNIKLNQRQLGYATLYGIIDNTSDDIWFESVTHDADGFAYAIGSNNWNGDYAHIYKFTPEGELVWQRQLYSGDGASFYVEWDNNVYTVANVLDGGEGYKVGDRIIIPGGQLSGTDGINSLTLEVATITNADNYVGDVSTVNIVSGVANGSGNASGVQDGYDAAQCQEISMTFDPVTGNLVVLLTTPTYNGDTYDNTWTETVLLLIDSGSGTVVSTTTLKDEGDIYAKDAAVSVTGKIAVVGEKYNEYAEYGAVTPLVGSAVDKLWVAKSDIDAEHFPGEQYSNSSDWWITGSSITDQVQVYSVNEYSGLTGTVRQGSGATFTIADNGDGTYGVSQPTLGGTNYQVGHKIKVLGTEIGGATPANDCVVTVIEINPTTGAITILGDVSGTAAGVAYQAYNDLSGTNYNVGSGADFLAWFDPTTGAITNYGINNNVGQNYVVGDVITIPGTSFAGGTSPANDLTVTVTSVGGSGDLQNPVNFSGSSTSTHLLISTNASVDFTSTATTFAIKQNLGGEAFVWTRDFNKAIGGANTDKFTGVVWNSTGTHLYAVGTGRYEVSYQQALVVKFSSTGTLLASKFVNDNMGENSAEYGSVALMANDCIVVVHDQYNEDRGETDEVLVTKLDSDLNIVWQQFIGVEDGNGSWDSPYSPVSVAVDPATDEILLAWESDDNSDIINDDAVYIVKLDTDGEILWKRIFGIHESDNGINWNDSGNKALSIHGDQFTLVGFTDGPSDETDNAFIVTLPLDGTGVGLHGIWTYSDLNDNRIKVWRLSNTTSTSFTPTVNSGAITYTDNIKYYYTNYPNEGFTFYPQVIRSNEGGAIEFADGSKQTFSTALVPQVRISENRYTIRPEDSGRHILIDDGNYRIRIPNWQIVTLPVGFTFTIVNITNSTTYVENEDSNNYRGEMWLSGSNSKTPLVGINDNGSGQMVTLMKIKEGTISNDGDNHGDIWMIAGADIFDDF